MVKSSKVEQFKAKGGIKEFLSGRKNSLASKHDLQIENDVDAIEAQEI
ncbi:MAG: hypothetical protein AB7U85_07435 [Alphaproteobacteria bacterium]